MKQLVKIARSYDRINTQEIELDLPVDNKFYKKTYYPTKVVDSIFAIIPDNNRFLLIQVEMYSQEYNELSLRDFMQIDYAKNNPLRKIALDIFERKSYEHEVISEEEFVKIRNTFLNIDNILSKNKTL